MHKSFFIVAGSLSLLLGVIGIVLPGLPTTPFILLAAYCYSRASPRLHAWLCNNRLFGRMVRDWERDRSLSLRIKLLASALMLSMVLFSVWQFSGRPVVQFALLLLGVVGSVVVWRIPTRRQGGGAA